MNPIAAKARGRPLLLASLVVALLLGGPGAPEAQADPQRAFVELLRPERGLGEPRVEPALGQALDEVEARVRRLTERVELASGESAAARDQLARARLRLAELEAQLAQSEEARLVAERALEAAEQRIAGLEDQLESVHVRIVSLNAALASAETGLLVEARLGLLDPPPEAGAPAAPAEDGPSPHIQALLERLGAEPVRHGTLITVPGDLLFAFDSREIQARAHDVLGEVAEVLRHFAARDVLIVGHTDATGDPRYNQLLSERRAEAVRDFFVRRFGLDRERFKTAGMSDSRPIAANDTPEGRSANRRVEVVIHNPDLGPTLAGANGASSASAR